MTNHKTNYASTLSVVHDEGLSDATNLKVAKAEELSKDALRDIYLTDFEYTILNNSGLSCGAAAHVGVSTLAKLESLGFLEQSLTGVYKATYLGRRKLESYVE